MLEVTLLLTQVLVATPPTVVESVRGPLPHTLEVGVGSGAFMPAAGGQGADETALSVGFRLAYFPWTFLGAEAEAVHVASRQGATDIGGYAVRGSVIAQIPGRLTPFLLGGAGLLGRPTERDPESAPAAHWGAGVRWFTHPNINLRVEARHVVGLGPGVPRQDVEALVGFGFTLFAVENAASDLLAESPARPRRFATVR